MNSVTRPRAPKLTGRYTYEDHYIKKRHLMSMLQAALSREGVARNHTAAVALDRGAERAAVVAAIHKAFKPEQAALEKLVVRGQLLAAAPVSEIQKQGLRSSYEQREKDVGSPY